MQVKSNAERGAFCNTFDLHKATIYNKDLCGVYFERPFYTGFTVINGEALFSLKTFTENASLVQPLHARYFLMPLLSSDDLFQNKLFQKKNIYIFQ